MKQNMRKSICILLMLIMTMTIPAYAGEPSITYDGNARNYVFAPGSAQSPTDLFPDFKNVMPGDTLKESIVLRNGSSNKKIKVYMRSLGGVEDKEFLSEMMLHVKLNDSSQATELFDAPADQKSGLTEWTLLGTLRSGAEVKLEVELLVPITMDNRFQDKVGKLQWEFKAEEITSGGSGGSSGGGGSHSSGSTIGGPGIIVDELTVIEDPEVPLAILSNGFLPKTGDTTNLTLWIAMLVVSGGLFTALMVVKKRMFEN